MRCALHFIIESTAEAKLEFWGVQIIECPVLPKAFEICGESALVDIDNLNELTFNLVTRAYVLHCRMKWILRQSYLGDFIEQVRASGFVDYV